MKKVKKFMNRDADVLLSREDPDETGVGGGDETGVGGGEETVVDEEPVQETAKPVNRCVYNDILGRFEPFSSPETPATPETPETGESV